MSIWDKFGHGNIVVIDNQLATIHRGSLEIGDQEVYGIFAIIPDNFGNRRIEELRHPQDAVFVSFNKYDMTDEKIRSAMTISNLRRRYRYERQV